MTTPSSGPSGTGRVISDLIDIPHAVHDGDLVVKLTESTSTRQAQALDEYVVTPQLAETFDQALEMIRSSLADNKSQAAYLHGSFGAGKSHFLAVLSAILDHHPDARSKPGLADLLAKHDSWLSEKNFIEVKAHLVEDEVSIEANILGGYVRQVQREYPNAPVPAVYRADGLLADAQEQRSRMGDEDFIALLPARQDSGGPSGGQLDDGVWGALAGPSTWDSRTLDEAFAVHPETEDLSERGLREELVSALLGGPFKRYTDAVGDAGGAYVSIDEGLSVISRHAKEHLGRDAVILLLDELILRFTAFIGDEARISSEVQKIAKLVESSHSHRPAPIISFVPRQRDLRELVGLGGGTEGISQTISYWDGRFGHIKLADANLTEVARHRLIKPRNDEAAAEIDTAFERMRSSRAEVRDTLLDSGGGADTSTWEDFRSLYPFSPAVLHVLVELSYALQRQRSAIKLLLELLVKYRTTLPVGQVVPLGAVFDVLIEGEAKPFKDHLSAEYTKISNFYRKVRLWLLDKHEVTEADVGTLDVRSPFRRDDLLVKTLLLSALTPHVPALKDLTVGRVMALNQGIVKARRPRQDVKAATTFFQDLQAQFGEVRVGAQSDNPTLSLNLLRVDTESLMRSAYPAANDHALRQLFKHLLWEELGLEAGAERSTVLWRGTQRTVELTFGNVRSSDDLGREEFRPLADNAVRVVIDYPFDEGDHTPAEDRRRVQELREEFNEAVSGLVWLPTFLSPNKLEDARRILMMDYLLQPDVIEEKAPDWSSDDRREARAQLDNQRNQLSAQISGLLRGAYGLVEIDRDSTDYGAPADPHIEPLPQGLSIPLEAGSQFPAALERITTKLLDHLYPEHPDLSGVPVRKTPLRRPELNTVLTAVEQAKDDSLNRYEGVPKSDLPVLKRLAEPLRIATVGEVFVLREDWRLEIDRFVKANMPTSTDVRVGDLKKWIRAREDGRGLPEDIVDLLVMVYAVQSDRAWIRAGKRYTGAEIGRLSDEIVLRRQEMPSKEDFERANERAQSIFGLPAQPLFNSSSVQRLAEQLKEQAHRLQAGSEHLMRELTKHTRVLGLDEDAPRLRTARAADELLGRLSGLTDDTALVNALGQADLPEEGGVYRTGIAGAGNLAQALAAARWDLLESLETIIHSGNKHSGEAEQILTRLREAARHNESSLRLATELSKTNSAVSALNNLIVREAAAATRPPRTEHRPDHDATSQNTDVTVDDEAARPTPSDTLEKPWVTLTPDTDLDTVVADLRADLGIPQDAKIQITIREVE